MKRKSYTLISSLLLVVLAIATLAIKSNVPELIKQPPATTQSTQRSSQSSQNDVNFDEEKYPDFYRIEGKANIEKNLKPGEIIYTKFDDKGRTLGVYANLTNNNFKYGKRERENINDIKPSGWMKNKEVTLHFLDGTTYHGWFYNRSHLLAHSLGGDDKDYNMITGTRPQNVGKNNGGGGMQYTEMQAYQYLEKHRDGQIYYSAVPNYTGGELVPRTVTVNIRSNDGSIDQRVTVYNVAPGYAIDYATGEFNTK